MHTSTHRRSPMSLRPSTCRIHPAPPPVTPTPPTWEATLTHYRAALRARGHRPRGIERYTWILRQYLSWLGDVADHTRITERSIRRYQEDLAGRCAPGSVGNFLTVVRSFVRWALREELRSDDPTLALEWPKKARRMPRALRQEELRLLWTAIADRGTSSAWTWRRNRRTIFVMYFAGLRLTEAADLRWRDVDLGARQLVVWNGKGGGSRCVPLHPELLAELELVPVAERHPDQYVCGRRDGKRMHPQSLAHIFEHWLAKRGLRINAHRLRHTFATQILATGGDIRRIQELLGHRQLSTTEIYLSVDVEQCRVAVNGIPASW